MEDISPFDWATDTPVLDFWWRLVWVSKPGWIPSLHALLPAPNGFLRFTSGATPTDLDFLFWMLSMFQTQIYIYIYIYVSLRLRVQNAVPAQPCVGKYWISLILLNFLHCNFRLWFKTPQPFNSYPCHASEVTRNTLNHCLKFTVCSIFCHICYGKISEKNVNTFFKVKLFVSKTSDSCFKVLICFKCS